MAERTTEVRLNHPLFRGILSLKRTPVYLRFVCKGITGCSRNWDALDQLDDKPEPGEFIIVGRLGKRGSMHLDRVVNGRRVGEWYQTADYDPVDDQPPQDVLSDNAKWREWAENRDIRDLPAAADAPLAG